MSRTKIGIATATIIGAAALAWWRPWSPASFGVASLPAATAAAENPGESSSAAPVAVEGEAAAPEAATPSVPQWEERLNRMVNLAGKIPQAELDTEIEELAATLPQEDALAVLNLQLLPDADKMPVISHLGVLLIQRWAEGAPADAADWLAKVPEGAFTRTAYRRVADAWGRSDLDGAISWLEKLPPNGNKPGAQMAVASQAADQEKGVVAIGLLAPLPAGSERDRLLNYSARQWSTQDREGAARWVSQVPDPALREKILGEIAIDWAVTEPAKGANFALTAVPPGKKQEIAVATSVRNWAVLSPDQAAAWVERFSEGELRNAAIESVAEVWAKDDPVRAAEWLQRLPAGPSRDAAIGMFASTVAERSPEQAARWADTIQDEHLRAALREQLNGKGE